jgi:hypothetical protein
MRKIVLTFGLIAGAILSVMMLLTMPFHDQIGFDKGMIIGYTSMVLAFLMIFFGVKSYRDNVAGGRVSFGKAFQIGMLITLVATACYVATWQVVYRKVVPDYDEKYTAYSLDQARQAGATPEELAEKEREMKAFWEKYQNPLVNIAFTSLEPLPVGLIFTLVSAGVLSRKRREPDTVTA